MPGARRWTGLFLLSWTPLIAFILCIAGVAAWALRFPEERLLTHFMTLSPLFLSAALCIAIVSFTMSWKGIAELFSGIAPFHWGLLGGIMLAGFVLAHAVAPRTHRIYFDEGIYENIGLNLAFNHPAGRAHHATWDYGFFNEQSQVDNKEGNTWPYLISIAFRVFGARESVAYNFTNILFAIAILEVFLCGYFLTKNVAMGLFSALIYAVIPTNALWFSTTAIEPATATLSTLFVLATLLAFRLPSARSALLAASVAALAVQCRPETILLLALIIVIATPNGWPSLEDPRFQWAWVVLFILMASHLIHLYALRHHSWEASGGPKFSLEYFRHNFATNTRYYFDGKVFPVLFTVLAALGFFWPGQRRFKALAGLWILLAWGVFLFFYAGSYTNGVQVRFAVLSFAPLALVAGAGTMQGWTFLRGKVGDRLGTSLVLTIFALNVLYYVPRMRETTEEAWACRADYEAVREFAALMPKDAFVYSDSPELFHLMDRSAAQVYFFQNSPGEAEYYLTQKYKDKMYLHWGYYCNVSDVPRQNIRYVTDRYDTELVSEKIVRDQRFALYRIRAQKPRITPGPATGR